MWRRVLLPILLIMPIPMLATDRVLVVTATAGYRHESIETAEQVITQIGAKTGWFEVTLARNESDMIRLMSPEVLDSVKLVMFVNTTGELPIATKQNLLRWINSGGTFIGVHSASDTWHDSPDYISMLGGEFKSHSDQTTVQIIVDAPDHPAVRALESPHTLFEEIYLFQNFSRDTVNMLFSLRQDPADPTLRGFFPLAWYKKHGKGRVLYTALGHRIDIWTSDWFQQHITNAIGWALDQQARPRRRSVGHH
jgi:type 1 glutamine amidotransferase